MVCFWSFPLGCGCTRQCLTIYLNFARCQRSVWFSWKPALPLCRWLDLVQNNPSQLWKAGECQIPFLRPRQNKPLVSYLEHVVGKSHALMLFKDWQSKYPIHFSGVPLVEVQSVELLDITLCHNPLCEDHVTKFASFLSCIECIIAYSVFRWCLIECYSLLWLGASASHLVSLETVEYNAFCAIRISRQEVDSQGLSISYWWQVVRLFYASFHQAFLLLHSLTSALP